MDDIVRVIKTLENSVVLTDRVSKTVKPEKNNKKVDFLVCF